MCIYVYIYIDIDIFFYSILKLWMLALTRRSARIGIGIGIVDGIDVFGVNVTPRTTHPVVRDAIVIITAAIRVSNVIIVFKVLPRLGPAKGGVAPDLVITRLKGSTLTKPITQGTDPTKRTRRRKTASIVDRGNDETPGGGRVRGSSIRQHPDRTTTRHEQQQSDNRNNARPGSNGAWNRSIIGLLISISDGTVPVGRWLRDK